MRDVRRIDWLGLLETWGLRVLAAILIFLLGRWLARRLARGLDRVLTRAGVDATLGGFLRNIAYAVMIVLVIMTALTALGVPTTSMFALLGAAGLAVGLAIKDSLSNIAAGVMLIVLRPFRAGDHVVIAGQEGIVQEIRVFQTWLRSFDHRMIILPNSQITTTQIVNYSTLPLRRMEVTVGVGYDDDLKKARALLLEIARQHPAVVDDPPPVVRIVALADSSITLTLYAFTRNDDHMDARSEIIEAVRDAFAANGLSIPYPQRDLHVYYAEPAPAAAKD
ncbi:mechanosensitive ion channel family protein [Thermomonas alba]|uniref:mechanosensitive ion channel family protein n=1 Tax=Thermomonas alba TaxID=2888525 RepID=UPI0023D95351|nr:mechanosensitive ion channel domain-containing protein [Thermomonas alba]